MSLPLKRLLHNGHYVHIVCILESPPAYDTLARIKKTREQSETKSGFVKALPGIIASSRMLLVWHIFVVFMFFRYTEYAFLRSSNRVEVYRGFLLVNCA